MKKLLFIISLILVVTLGACAPSESYTKDEVDLLLQELRHERNTQIADLQSQIDVMLEQDYYTEEEIDVLISTISNAITVLENDVFSNADLIDELEQVLISIEVIEGLNGQKVYYVPEQNAIVTLSALSNDKIDKSKAPSYIMDENDEYIDFEEVVNKLATKYYGENANVIEASLSFQAKINIDTTLDKHTFIARTILFIQELSDYEFYIIGSSQLYIQTNTFGATSYITVPIQTLRSSFITMDKDVFANGWYEVNYHNLVYDVATVEALLLQYNLDGTYIGYVLDYK